MGRVNVEQQALTDSRFQRLARLIGTDRHAALGRMVVIWNECLERGRYELTHEDVLDLHPDVPHLYEALVESGLAKDVAPNVIYISGTRGRIEWLTKKRENGKKFGSLGAEFGKLGGRPNKPSDRVFDEPLDPVTETPAENPPPAPAPAPALAQHQNHSRPTVAPLPPAGNCGQALKQEQRSFNDEVSRQGVEGLLRVESGQTHRSPSGTSSDSRETNPQVRSASHSESDGPAEDLANHFIAALSAREPLFVAPAPQKWMKDCASLIARAENVGMTIVTLKAVIADAIAHDGENQKRSRYYMSPAAFIGEWKNGTDKLNAAVSNWRARTSGQLTPVQPGQRDYDAIARERSAMLNGACKEEQL